MRWGGVVLGGKVRYEYRTVRHGTGLTKLGVGVDRTN